MKYLSLQKNARRHVESRPVALNYSMSGSSRHGRTLSPPLSATSYSYAATAGQQKLNVVTRLAIEGKSKKGWDGASIKMYLKVREAVILSPEDHSLGCVFESSPACLQQMCSCNRCRLSRIGMKQGFCHTLIYTPSACKSSSQPECESSVFHPLLIFYF